MPDWAVLSFRCNICGSVQKDVPRAVFGREDPSCSACGSSVRMRGIIHYLSLGLFGTSIPLPDFPTMPNISGIGLSDWEGYANGLSVRLNYTNTFFHKQPFLDVLAPDPAQVGKYDFLISADVFEHVPPPVFRAFAGSYALLKAGGLLVITVPFTDVKQSIEHFPNLGVFKIAEFDGGHVLINRDSTGALTIHENLIFHGGPGDTLEMRVFSRADTLDWLQSAGFVNIEVHEGSFLEWGIVPPHHHGLPITARRPAQRPP